MNAFSAIAGKLTDCKMLGGIAEKVGSLGENMEDASMAVGAAQKSKMTDAMFANTNCLGDMMKDIGDMGDMKGDVAKKLNKDQWKGMDKDTFKKMTDGFAGFDGETIDADLGNTIIEKMGETFGDWDFIDEDTAGDLANLAEFIKPEDMKNMDPASIAAMGTKGLGKLGKDQFKAMAGNLADGLDDMGFEGFINDVSDDAFDLAGFAEDMGFMSDDQQKAIKDKQLKKMGGLKGVAGLTKEAIDGLGADIDTFFETFTDDDFGALTKEALAGGNYAKAAKVKNMGKAGAEKLAKLAEQVEGNADTWAKGIGDKLGKTAYGLDKATLDKITDNDVMEDIFKGALAMGTELFGDSPLLAKAKDLYKDPAKVTADVFDTLGAGLGDVFDSVDAIAKFPEDVVKTKMDKLRDAKWKDDQWAELGKQCKKGLGDLKTAGKAGGQKMGKLIGGLTADDFKEVTPEFLEGALMNGGDSFMELPPANLNTLTEQFKTNFPADKITPEFIKNGQKFMENVFDEALLEGIDETVIDSAIGDLLNLDFDEKESASVMKKLAKKAGKADKSLLKKAGKFAAAADESFLLDLKVEDFAGFSFDAVDDMEPTKLKKTFTPDKIKGLTANTRKGIQGAKLAAMDNDQAKAAVCPDGTCPGAITDAVFTFDPKKTSQKDIIAALKAKEDAAAKKTAGRRLADAAQTDSVTMRSKETSKADADTVAKAADATTVDGASSTSNAVAITDVTKATTPSSNPAPSNQPKKPVVGAATTAAPSALLAVVAVLAMVRA